MIFAKIICQKTKKKSCNKKALKPCFQLFHCMLVTPETQYQPLHSVPFTYISCMRWPVKPTNARCGMHWKAAQSSAWQPHGSSPCVAAWRCPLGASCCTQAVPGPACQAHQAQMLLHQMRQLQPPCVLAAGAVQDVTPLRETRVTAQRPVATTLCCLGTATERQGVRLHEMQGEGPVGKGAGDFDRA